MINQNTISIIINYLRDNLISIKLETIVGNIDTCYVTIVKTKFFRPNGCAMELEYSDFPNGQKLEENLVHAPFIKNQDRLGVSKTTSTTLI